MVSAKSVVSAAVLLAASSVSALGNAVVQNQCSFDVYLWSVGNTAGPMVTIPANGGEYSEPYKKNPNGGGISIKLASDKSASNITQFEYTLESADLWYDVSNINGYPFMEWGLTLVPSISTCRSIVCPAGTALCADAYNTPDENWATAECSSSASAVLVLCSGDESTTPAASISAVASSAAVTASAFSGLATPTATRVHTTFVTTVVTVEATAPATTSAPWWTHPGQAANKERRAGHLHRHAHAHGHQA